ncbi:hypothetical protein, variant [Aphanomyces invadans]|uniref:CDC20/Fizzy WD40 domain-containing protein n=1 Tax=Aphanomyces invadans TaxID=157072 RepID=A0A024TPM0_9STRA|nr:hypothetical protein, variant [Aphanomyces invadans]ETV95953.1 hypothetical protein, variant [Aphanomyces invadans]|eukprot:XP_008875264.1 hypothetical protein, variant [Aphanomyces invadans]
MEGTPSRRPEDAATSKPKVLWSSAKKAKRQKMDRYMSAEKENATAADRNIATLDVLNEEDIVQVEANLHGDFDSIKLPRWLRKRREMLKHTADLQVAPSSPPASSILFFTAPELAQAAAPPRDYRILRPISRPPPPNFPERQTGSVFVDYPRRVSSVSRVLFQADTLTKDDFYINVLATHPSQLTVACATLKDVVIYRAINARRTMSTLPIKDKLPSSSTYISSLAWTSPSHLAVGTSDANIYIYDVSHSGICVQSIVGGHSDRISSLAWSEPSSILSSGSRDASIAHHDLRLRQPTLPIRSQGHDQEVCGLAFAGNGTSLASGGNDNVVNIWDLKQVHRPVHRLMEHSAAVKALAWCPWEASLLASGGGTADKSIKLWNSNTGMLLQSKATHAQVSALVWSSPQSGNKYKELLSAHGFQSPAMTLWSYPSMQKIRSFTTRSGRILNLASNGSSHVVSWCSEGTLRQWDLFLPTPPTAAGPPGSGGLPLRTALARAPTTDENSHP